MEENNREINKGGRPKKEVTKSERIHLRFTPREKKAVEAKAEKMQMSVQDFCRLVLLEKELPNFEKNKTLIKYAHNFTLISNYMKKQFFTEQERAILLQEIRDVIEMLKQEIKW